MGELLENSINNEFNVIRRRNVILDPESQLYPEDASYLFPEYFNACFYWAI